MNQNIEVKFNPKEPIYVYADEFYIEQVVTNYFTNAIKNAEEVEKVKQIKISIKKTQAGAQLSASLKAANLFPKMILFMVSTGEQSGRLGELMEQSVKQIDQELDNIIDTLGKLIEPIMLIFIGVIVCFLALSLYLPLFQSYSV